VNQAPRQETVAGQTTARSTARLVAWSLLALAAFVGFIALGNWQVRRLHWKLRLIHDVATRVHAPPVAAPGPAQWPAIEHGHEQYLHVRLHGRFIAGKQTLVHGTSRYGYGFWAMAPLRTDRGFVVLVNRGYVPAGLPGTPAYARVLPPGGEVDLDGLLRLSEPGGGFLRSNQPAKGLWYSRDVAALAAAQGLDASRVAPYFVDADADAAGRRDRHDWPAAGQTVVHFPNHHLNYAITWYLMALGTLVGFAIAVRHQRRKRRAVGRAADR
jgi:surfeit locus 1 family protein